MRNILPSLLAISTFLFCFNSFLYAETEAEGDLTPKKKTETSTPSPVVVKKFEPFTGKITKNKVRVRLQSNYEGPIIREMNRGDLLLILGETDEFYAIKPPDESRGYVFRTYILDNVVEGERVNIRLQPDRDATIIAQLKTGDRIEGNPAQANNKWLEIKLPHSTRFFIAKEYVEKVGDIGFKDRLDQKRNAAYDLLLTTDAMSKSEMMKPYNQMGITGIKANYQHIINDYQEFPEIITLAQESLNAIQNAYTAKKIAYLEEQSRHSSSTIEVNKKLSVELQAHRNKINDLEQQIEQNKQTTVSQPALEQPIYSSKKPSQLPVNMSTWIPVEEALYNEWTAQPGKNNPQDFYEEQKEKGFVLRGIIDPYTRPLKNKPGDYMLLNSSSKLPVAFIYSTHINLQDYVGHEVSITVTPRNNNNFAFPAYFVLAIE